MLTVGLSGSNNESSVADLQTSPLAANAGMPGQNLSNLNHGLLNSGQVVFEICEQTDIYIHITHTHRHTRNNIWHLSGSKVNVKYIQ